MPNWCMNNASLTHSDSAMMTRLVTAIEAKRLFDEFVPRPADQEDNWYQWSIENWGTKWRPDIEDVDTSDPHTVDLSFDSAWSPPIEFYRRMTELGFTVSATYYEPGTAYVGQYTSDEDDDCYSIPETAAEVRDIIPSHLDEEWGISEYMEDVEAENGEDDEWSDEDEEEDEK